MSPLTLADLACEPEWRGWLEKEGLWEDVAEDDEAAAYQTYEEREE